MKRITLFFRLAMVLFLLAPTSSVALAKGGSEYQTGFNLWRGADDAFTSWVKSGTILVSGNVEMDFATSSQETDPYTAGSYYGGNFYNGGSYTVGEITSPELTPGFGFTEAIASWNADTPAGTWIETQIRVQFTEDEHWSKWYNLGIWASGDETIRRHSVSLQGDTDGYVAVDTLVVTAKKLTVQAYQLKARLFSADGVATPILRNLSLAYSITPPKKAGAVSSGDPALWNKLLDVPECSQMVYGDEGGEVWCSPTSTSMVLGFWGFMQGDCAPRVRATVAGVYDWIYDGHGNWPFNTAFAAAQGYEGYVARFTSLAQAEPWIAAGVPVVMSVAWGKGDLTGAPIDSTNGHLITLVGFDASGNAIVNDPAAASNDDVQRTYLRSELEPLWLEASGGTVYLIFPAGTMVPLP